MAKRSQNIQSFQRATPEAVYVLHAFQKKGIETPKTEIALIEQRLKNLIDEKETRR